MQSKVFKKRAVLGAAAVAAALLAGAAQAKGVPGQGTWETTLQPRDLNGDSVADAFYDTTLNVTWLRDANVNGRMKWPKANNWANALVVGGISDWRLPTMIDTGTTGCNYSDTGGTDCGHNVQTKSGDPTRYEAGQTVYSEMAHLFHVTLGNKSFCPPNAPCSGPGGPQPGWGLTNTGNFQDMVDSYYWSGLEYPPPRRGKRAWSFNTNYGSQNGAPTTDYFWALAVRPGDVAAVPEPQTYVLLMLGLTALAVVRRRPR